MAHLGTRVSALLDGHLPAAEAERCWDHVHACHACRDLVEQEGWVKTRLAQLSLGDPAHGPSHDLKSSLLGRCPGAASHSSPLAAPMFPTAPAGTRGRRGLVAIGGGAASACVVGVLALGVAGSPRVEPRPPTTDITRPTSPGTPVRYEDRAARTPSRTPLAERLQDIREKIAP